jgi:hypothetical protein
VRHIDAKSTRSEFDAKIFLSVGEIEHATTSVEPYDLYRLYKVSESGGRLRIARDVKSKLIPVVDALKRLPPGVRADSFSFKPSFFEFEPTEIKIEQKDEE